MNDSDHRQHTDQKQLQLTHTRPTRAPLLRRTFLGGLGVAAGLGLLGTARGSKAVNQRAARPATEVTGTSAAEANGGTVGLVCIGIFVRDLPESLNFYRRLGLAIPEDAGGNNDYRLRLPTGQVLFWETYEAVRAFDPNWQPASGNRRAVLEFGFATAQALDDKYAELTSAGYKGYLAPFTFSNSTIRYALIKDPDGNEIALRNPEC